VHLRGIGKLAEIIPLFRRGADIYDHVEMWAWASVSARYLGETHAVLGELDVAITDAARSVDYADRTADQFERMVDPVSLGEACTRRAASARPRARSLKQSA
jgi:hypothetical protein